MSLTLACSDFIDRTVKMPYTLGNRPSAGSLAEGNNIENRKTNNSPLNVLGSKLLNQQDRLQDTQ